MNKLKDEMFIITSEISVHVFLTLFLWAGDGTGGKIAAHLTMARK
jgi:hypothetical protein